MCFDLNRIYFLSGIKKNKKMIILESLIILYVNSTTLFSCPGDFVFNTVNSRFNRSLPHHSLLIIEGRKTVISCEVKAGYSIVLIPSLHSTSMAGWQSNFLESNWPNISCFNSAFERNLDCQKIWSNYIEPVSKNARTVFWYIYQIVAWLSF